MLKGLPRNEAVGTPFSPRLFTIVPSGVCWVANRWGVPFATGTAHHIMNALAWGLDLGLLVALDQLLTRCNARRTG